MAPSLAPAVLGVLGGLGVALEQLDGLGALLVLPGAAAMADALRVGLLLGQLESLVLVHLLDGLGPVCVVFRFIESVSFFFRLYSLIFQADNENLPHLH